MMRQIEAGKTRIAPGLRRAKGQPIEGSGTLRSETGRPVAGAVMDIWSGNTFRRYTHREDHSGLQLALTFWDWGVW